MSDSKGAAIDELLLRVWRDGREDGYEVRIGERRNAIETAHKAILAILAQEVKRVIGEDDKQNREEETDGMLWCNNCDVELTDLSEPMYACNCTVKNQLRAEQRRKAGLV